MNIHETDVEKNVNEAKNRTGEIVAKSIENVKEQSEKLRENVVNYATESPFKLFGAVLLVGIAVGYLIRR